MPKKINLIILVTLLLAACSPTKQLVQYNTKAHTAFLNQEYAEALQLYEQHFQQHTADQGAIPDSLIRNAGISAFEIGQNEKALTFLNQIRHTDAATEHTHYILAVLNRDVNNLSREITALESYITDFPDATHANEMRHRLFETYVESRNYEHALELWTSIESDARKQETHLDAYFVVLEAMENENELYKVSEELLTLNPNNNKALYFLARHYFWKAENRYQSEMEAYENNRTNRQYAQLLRAFDILNADFRKSLSYFLKLYEVDPEPRYARFIGNIYLRFDDKARAAFYHEKANN